MYCCSGGCQKHAECNLLVRALCVLGSLNVFLTGPLLASSIEDHFPMQWGLHPSPPPQPFRMLSSSPSLPPFLLPLSQTPTLYLPLNCPLLVLLPPTHTLPPPTSPPPPPLAGIFRAHSLGCIRLGHLCGWICAQEQLVREMNCASSAV